MSSPEKESPPKKKKPMLKRFGTSHSLGESSKDSIGSPGTPKSGQNAVINEEFKKMMDESHKSQFAFKKLENYQEKI